MRGKMATRATTERGQATRWRIVSAACELIQERGVAATSLGDVRQRAGVSQSQLYHYFGDKHGLLQAVVDATAGVVVDAQVAALEQVGCWGDLEAWSQTIVARIAEREGRGGCPVGTLAAATADTDEDLRASLAAAFERWRAGIRTALEHLRDAGELDRHADVDALATATLAAIQGGLLLAKTARDSAPLAVALAAATAQLRAHAA